MFSFGSHKPRSLDSFGISGVLRPDTEVFYNVLFSTRHLGRVSDLLCARLSKARIDELKLRTTLVLGVLEAYRAQFKRTFFRVFSSSDRDVLDEPLLLECGIDNEKLALGVFFNLHETVPLALENLPARILSKDSKTPFEELLVKLQEHSDRMILKFQPSTRKMEIILLIALPGKIADATQKRLPEILIFEKKEIAPAPRPKKYVNLGDLNYPKLLNEKVRTKKQLFSPTGEFLMPGESTPSEEKILVSSDPNFVSSADPDGLIGESRQRREEVTEEALQVQGSGADLSNQDIAVVSDAGGPKKKSRWRGSVIKSMFSKAKKALNGLVKGMMASDEQEAELGPEIEPNTSDLDEGGVEAQTRVSSLSKEGSGTELEAQGAEGISVDEPVSLSSLKGKVDDPELESKKLAAELKGGGLDKLIRGIQSEMSTATKDTYNPKTKKWMEDLIGKLASERARLSEITRKVNLSVRLKTLDLNTKLNGIQEELKRKELQLNQKSKSLIRSEETLAEVNKNLEQLKSQTQGAESSQFKQKYNLTHRMLVISKEENALLSTRVEELKSQLHASQASRAGKNDSSEFSELRDKYDRLYRQAEEFKKANRQLMGHLNDPKKERIEGNEEVEEKKRRFEAAMKLIAISRKETSEAKNQIAEYRNREAALKTEVLKLQTQLKIAENEKKAEAAKKSGDGTNGSSTPAAA